MKGRTLKEDRKGFTLIELVVVIAILAILAAVAYPVYNGYIDYTHKGVDRQTVGEVMHAIELADYSDPDLFDDNGTAMVLISTDGAKVYGVNGITEAIEDATPLSSVKLSYNDWGLPSESLLSLLNLISAKLPDLGKGDTYVGYADVANECWDAVKGLAEVYGETDAESVEVVLKVAGMTTGADGLPAWESFDSFDYTSMTSDLIIPVRASRLARNFAFAAFLEKNYGSDPEVQEVVKVLTSLTEEDGDNPLASEFDFLTKDASKHGIDEYNNAYSSHKIEWSGYDDAVTAYLNSQAKIDGDAYYTFMNGVYDQYKGNMDGEGHYTGNAKEFWDEAAGYINWAAGIGSGQIDVNSMKTALTDATGSNVVIVANKRDGNLSFNVSPEDASPRKTETIAPVEDEETILEATKENISTGISIDLESGKLTATCAAGSTGIKVVWTTLKSLKTTVVIPSGYTLKSISCGSSTVDYVTKLSATEEVESAFKVVISGTIETPTISLNSKKSANAANASTTIIFTLADASGSEKTVNVAVELIELGR